jgi:hypothetical protein
VDDVGRISLRKTRNGNERLVLFYSSFRNIKVDAVGFSHRDYHIMFLCHSSTLFTCMKYCFFVGQISKSANFEPALLLCLYSVFTEDAMLVFLQYRFGMTTSWDFLSSYLEVKRDTSELLSENGSRV